jgi:hypothetical protein
LGQGDGPAGIFDNGITTFQNVGAGLWNGDAPAFTNGNSQPAFPWFSQQGAAYGSNKIVYLSPQFFGIGLGGSFAPNNDNGGGTYNCANAATIGCPLLSSSNQVSASGIPTDNFRERNLSEVGARYQGVIGPTSIYAWGTWIGANHVNYTGPAVTPAILGVPGSKYNGQVTDVSAGFIGAAVTIAGFQFGGAWQGGHYNNTVAPAPNGAPPAEAYLVGFAYTNGPFTIGGSWYGFDTQGAVQLTGISQRHENAFALGGNWQIPPGLQLYSEYVYGTNHQGDFNFVTSAVGTAHNNALSQAFVVGLLVGW